MNWDNSPRAARLFISMFTVSKAMYQCTDVVSTDDRRPSKSTNAYLCIFYPVLYKTPYLYRVASEPDSNCLIENTVLLQSFCYLYESWIKYFTSWKNKSLKFYMQLKRTLRRSIFVRLFGLVCLFFFLLYDIFSVLWIYIYLT